MNILEYIERNGGYARMRELRMTGFHTRDVSMLVEKGLLVKLAPGLYRLHEIPETGDVNPGFVDVCMAVKNGVVCLLSALAHYELTTFNPAEIYTAIPGDRKPPSQIYIPVKIFYFYHEMYDSGITTLATGYGDVRIYNREKTLCDVFRYRSKLGEDVALEGLKRYLESDKANIGQLMHYADICGVRKNMMPYLKAMTIA